MLSLQVSCVADSGVVVMVYKLTLAVLARVNDIAAARKGYVLHVWLAHLRMKQLFLNGHP